MSKNDRIGGPWEPDGDSEQLKPPEEHVYAENHRRRMAAAARAEAPRHEEKTAETQAQRGGETGKPRKGSTGLSIFSDGGARGDERIAQQQGRRRVRNRKADRGPDL